LGLEEVFELFTLTVTSRHIHNILKYEKMKYTLKICCEINYIIVKIKNISILNKKSNQNYYKKIKHQIFKYEGAICLTD
jgi:hypothetical protein